MNLNISAHSGISFECGELAVFPCATQGLHREEVEMGHYSTQRTLPPHTQILYTFGR